jgi:hypothetical protein
MVLEAALMLATLLLHPTLIHGQLLFEGHQMTLHTMPTQIGDGGMHAQS